MYVAIWSKIVAVVGKRGFDLHFFTVPAHRQRDGVTNFIFTHRVNKTLRARGIYVVDLQNHIIAPQINQIGRRLVGNISDSNSIFAYKRLRVDSNEGPGIVFLGLSLFSLFS